MSDPGASADRVSIVRLPPGFHAWHDLLSLIRLAFAPMDRVIDPPSSVHALTLDNLRMKAGQESVFLAMEGYRLIGCVFAANRGNVLYLGKLAVAPGKQRMGIGRRLIEAAEAFARSEGRQALELQTRVELVANQMAFVRLGFYETARTAHPGYDRPTSITMRKDLAS